MAKEMDERVIPMVEYFNSENLKTMMSCQGHNDTNVSMFWIEFDWSVSQDDIVEFMKKHTDKYGNFFSCGRFAKRVIWVYGFVRETWCYFAATPEAADTDLQLWTMGGSHQINEVEGAN